MTTLERTTPISPGDSTTSIDKGVNTGKDLQMAIVKNRLLNRIPIFSHGKQRMCAYCRIRSLCDMQEKQTGSRLKQ